MTALARFIVRFRSAIFFIFVALACVCALLALNVSVNRDMTKYLPEDFEMTQGMNIMTEEFGESSVFNIMVKGVPQDEREDFASDLGDFCDLGTVDYDAESSSCNKGDYALFMLSSDVNSYSDDADSVVSSIEGFCAARGYECWIDNEGLDSGTAKLGPVLIAAVIIAMIILFILANSWLEPLLLLFTILIAVVINLGTNIFFGTISDTTNACGAILQMALSMDYLIMLLNRYRREHTGDVSAEEAMVRAIKGGMTAIASSSVTTIVGLLCLVLMSFTIGRDMGLVLAKGVLLSLICAFAMMPALVLWFDYFLEHTAKPSFNPKMKHLGSFSYKMRYPMVAIFVVLLVAGFGLRSLATTSFITDTKSDGYAAIEKVFDLDSQVVVLYDLDDEEALVSTESAIENMAGTSELSDYHSTINTPLSAKEVSEKNDINKSFIDIVFYDYFNKGKTPSINGNELVSFVESGFAKSLGDQLDSDTADDLESLASLMEDDLGNRFYTLSQAEKALSSHPSIHASTLRLIYLAYGATHNAKSSWAMTTEQLMDFLANNVVDDEAFSEFIDDDTRESLIEGNDTIQDTKEMFQGTEHGRCVLQVGYAADSDEMAAYVKQLRSTLKAAGVENFYLVGQGPMIQEMAASFTGEFNFLSIVTIIAILLIVLITFRNFIIPIVLVALIQSAFCWDMVLSGLMDKPIYYVALLVVQSILMGATIDYAILFTTSYREAREHMAKAPALIEAYHNSIRTISMSGSILVFVCLVLGIAVPGITGQICLVISEGAFAAVLLVLLVLPGVIAAFDRLVVPKKRRFEEHVN